MDLILVLVATTTFPVGCLGFLLWMARFEDGLPEAVRRAARHPDPPPVLEIPVQRRRPPLELTRTQVAEDSRSVAVSRGGSTNR